jgi:alcohol dehydrogenase
VLDTVMEASAPAVGDAFCEVGIALGAGASAGAAVDACRELADEVGARKTLGELGVDEALLPTLAADALADTVSRNAPWLPSAGELTDLLRSRL